MLTKFRNVPVEVDGVRYASKREARRAAELNLLERAGKISDLKHQPRFPLVVNGVKIAAYVADASYLENGVLIVEDVKSPVTAKHPVYRLKAKLMQAVHGIIVREVR